LGSGVTRGLAKLGQPGVPLHKLVQDVTGAEAVLGCGVDVAADAEPVLGKPRQLTCFVAGRASIERQSPVEALAAALKGARIINKKSCGFYY
jgi:hypothetical protein